VGRAVLFVCLLAGIGPRLAAAAPNILLIVADDLGWSAVPWRGSPARMPNLERLRTQGTELLRFYASPVCSPTRAALFTGRSAVQQRICDQFAPNQDGLSLLEHLLPESFAAAGYRTALTGKWHLGATPAHTPWARGFDQTYGFIGGGHSYSGWAIDVKKEYNVPLTRDGQATTEVPAHLTATFGQEAAAFVKRNAGAPWMLYLAFNAPHTPHMPTVEREKRFADVKDPARRQYLAQISLLDDAIGEVTKALAASDQTKDTIVFFFSDNGGPPASIGPDNTPLRANKGTVYEGGVRVPFVVSWLGQLKAGSTYARPVSSLDVTATALALAGVPQPTERRLDGINLLPFLKGENTGEPHASLFWRTGGGTNYAVRSGDWKLVRNGKQPDELYDLATDISEAKDLAAAKPEVVAKLSADLSAWDKELIAPLFQSPKPAKAGPKKAKK